MSPLVLEGPDLYEIEAENSPLMGSRTAVFVPEEERFWVRQEETIPAAQFGRFIGRDRELEVLSGAIARRAPVITISGTAGVGKTALIQNLLSRYSSIAHVDVKDFNDPWSAVASALLTTYGKIPDEATLSSHMLAGINPLTNPMVIVFDDLDRFPHRRAAKQQLSRLIGKLRPALGKWLTAVIVSRDITHFADDSIAHGATTIDLEPLSLEARHAFLTISARDIGVELEPETSKAIADTSLGLPVILKSFLARSIDRMVADAPRNEAVNLASFRGAIADSFTDLALAYDPHLLAVEKLDAIDWHVVQTMAGSDVFDEVNIEKLQKEAIHSHCSDRRLERTLRWLKAKEILTQERPSSGLVIQGHIFFAFIRAAQWLQSYAEPPADIFVMLTSAAKKARAAARY
jgi:hypothetical protein